MSVSGFGIDAFGFDDVGFAIDAFDVVTTADNKTFIFATACAGGYEVTADDVLFHAFERVGLAADSCLVEDLGCLLE